MKERSAQKSLAILVGTAAAYYAADWLGIRYPPQLNDPSALWLPAGIAVALAWGVPTAAAPADRNRAAEILADSARLAVYFDTEAPDYLESTRGEPNGALDGETLEGIARALGAFDFQGASRRIEVAIKTSEVKA